MRNKLLILIILTITMFVPWSVNAEININYDVSDIITTNEGIDFYYLDFIIVNDGMIGLGSKKDIDQSGNRDICIIKYDLKGNIIWKKTYGGSGNDHAFSIVDSKDGIIILGSTNSVDGDLTGKRKGTAADLDGLILKFDYNGNLIKEIVWGGTGEDRLFDMAEKDGYVYISGDSNSKNGDLATAGLRGYDGVILKYDFDLNFQWLKNWGGTNNDYFQKLSIVSDGFFAVGVYFSTSGVTTPAPGKQGDGILVKYDFDGNIIWEAAYGGTTGQDMFNAVIETSTGDYIAQLSLTSTAGSSIVSRGRADIALIKYSNTGTFISATSWGGSETETSGYFKTYEGRHFFIANTESNDYDMLNQSRGMRDTLLIEIDEDCNEIGRFNFGGSKDEHINEFYIIDNKLYVAGWGNSTDGKLPFLDSNYTSGFIGVFGKTIDAEPEYNKTEETTGPVVVTLRMKKMVMTPAGWTKIDDYTFKKEFTENVSFDLEVEDYFGNKEIVKINITNIIQVNPPTGDNIMINIIIGIIAIIGLISTFVLFKKKMKKRV